MESTFPAARRRPVELNRPAGVALLLWTGLIVESGLLALAVGWAPGGPVSHLLDAVLWPGSVVAFVGLGALARRGGWLLGLGGGTLVGLTCAIVVSMLPEAQLPLDSPTPLHRVHYVIEAVWSAPVVGLLMASAGMLMRRVILPVRSRDTESAAPRPAVAESIRLSEPAASTSALGRPTFMPVGLAIAAGASVSTTRHAATAESASPLG